MARSQGHFECRAVGFGEFWFWCLGLKGLQMAFRMAVRGFEAWGPALRPWFGVNLYIAIWNLESKI